MGEHQLRVAFILLLAVAIAACGAASPNEVTPAFAGAVPTAVPGTTLSAPDPSGRSTATILLEPGDADGPGVSISDAVANAGIGPQLVNGILLRAVDGSVWLCEAMLMSTSPAPQCAEPRLLVAGRAPEDQTLANGEGLHEAGGVRWIEDVQLFGVVHP